MRLFFILKQGVRRDYSERLLRRFCVILQALTICDTGMQMNTIKLSLPCRHFADAGRLRAAQNEAPAASYPPLRLQAPSPPADRGLRPHRIAPGRTPNRNQRRQISAGLPLRGGKTLQARYHAGEATAVAEVKIDGHTLTLQYDGVQSNEDLTAF